MSSLTRRQWLSLLRGTEPDQGPRPRSFLEDFYARRGAAEVPVVLHPTTLFYDEPAPTVNPEPSTGVPTRVGS